MLTRKHLRSITTVAALLALPVALDAQDPGEYLQDDEEPMLSNIELEAGAGIGMSAADLTEYTEPGLAVGAGAGFWLNPHVALRVDGDFNALRGAEAEAGTEAAPDMNIYHYGAGVELDLLGRDAVQSPWTVQLNAGAGGSTLDTDNFLDNPDEDSDLTETVANVNAGAEVGRQISDNLMVTLSGQAFYMFLDEDNFNNLADLRPAEGPIQDGVNIPVTLSLRWDIPTPGVTGN